MEPIKLEFVVKGDIDRELSRIQLAIKGVGDQSYTSFSRLLEDSNRSFTALSKGSQSFATTLQHVIGCLQANSQAQEALYEEYSKGTISSADYAEAQARLSVQQTILKNQASELVRQIENEIRQNNMVTGSLSQKLSLLNSLQQQYAGLSETQRNNSSVGGALATQIKQLNNEITTIQANLKQEQQVEVLVMGSLKQKQTLLGELQLQYAGLSEAERNNAATGGALATQIKQLNNEITAIQANLKEQQQEETLVDGSLRERIITLSKLREEYAKLGKTERESMIGTNLITQMQKVDEEIIRMQAGMGRIKIGANGFNSLGMSVQQVARELPSLTMGANMFFLAISNNLPILSDNIRSAKAEYNAFKAAGQAATPVWKQVLSSLVSWQTALVVGITLLSVYGKDIWEWTKSLFGAQKALDQNLESLDSFQKKVSESSGKTIASFKRIAAEWAALGDNMEAKRKYLLENVSAIDQLEISVTNMSEADTLFIKQEDAFIESLMLRAKAAASMEIAGEKYQEAVKKMIEAESMEEGHTRSYWNYAGLSQGGFQKTTFYEKNQERIDAEKEAAELFKSGDAIAKKSAEYSKKEAEIISQAGLRSTEEIVANSVAAIEASITQKKEALKRLTNKEDYAAAMIEIKKEEAALKSITGDTDNENKKIIDAQKRLKEIVLENELKLQSGRIAIMEDGKSKRLALVDQEYKEALAAIDKEKGEYLKTVKASKGKEDPAVLSAFDNREEAAGSKRSAETYEINKEYAIKYKVRMKAATDIFLTEEQRKLSAIKDRYDKERKWADEQLQTGGMTKEQHQVYTTTVNNAQSKESYAALLSELNDYKQQEADINAKWDTLIAEARSKNDILLETRLQEGKSKALSSLNAQKLQESEEWQQLFSDLDNLTVTQIDNLIATIESKAKGLKMNPVDLKEVTNSLNQAKQKVIEINPFSSLGKSFKEVFKSGSKESGDSTKNIKQDWNNLAKSTEGCFEFVNDAVDSCGVLGDLLGESGKQVMGMIQGIATAGIAMATAIKTAETSSIVLAAISLALQAVTALFAIFNGDKKHEKKIKDLQGQVENLEKAYDRLGRTIENTYSNEVYSLMDQQEAALRRQQALIRQQIREEEAKKKTDKDKVNEYKDKLEELDNQIEDSNRKQIEMWAGTDIQTAIDDFADALIEAYAQGEDGAKAMGDTTKKILANAVKEALKKQLLGKALQDAITQLGKDMEDGQLSAADRKRFEDSANAAGKRFTEAMKVYDDLFKDTENQLKDGVSGQLQAATTEGTASQLVGLWNSTAIDMRELKNIGSDQRDNTKLCVTSLGELVRQNILIEQHTRRGADNTDGLIDELKEGFGSLDKRLSNIEKNTKSYNGRG